MYVTYYRCREDTEHERSKCYYCNYEQQQCILNTVATIFLMRRVPVAKSGQPLVSTPLMLVIESPNTQMKMKSLATEDITLPTLTFIVCIKGTLTYHVNA